MVLNHPANDIHEQLEIISRGEKRDYHIQHLIHVALQYSVSLTPYNSNLVMTNREGKVIEQEYEFEYIRILRSSKALLYSIENSHMVAWDGKNVFDPRGFVHDLKQIRDYPCAFLAK